METFLSPSPMKNSCAGYNNLALGIHCLMPLWLLEPLLNRVLFSNGFLLSVNNFFFFAPSVISLFYVLGVLTVRCLGSFFYLASSVWPFSSPSSGEFSQ